MTAGAGRRVLVVGGTHGNERNAVRLLEHWRQDPRALRDWGFELVLVAGNPAAITAGRRYLDRDLNRSFSPSLLEDPGRQEREVVRAREMVASWEIGRAHV